MQLTNSCQCECKRLHICICLKRDVVQRLQCEKGIKNVAKKCTGINDSVMCCCTLWYIAQNGQDNIENVQKKKELCNISSTLKCTATDFTL